MKKVLNIEMWMLLVIVLLTACSDHSGESSDEKDDCFLNIYVYAPEHPMLTRADVGDIVSRSVKEHMVHTLQIWVFNHRDGSLVGYLEAEPTFLNETNGQEMFQMKVEKEFADHPVNVDVYVVANAFIDFTNRVKNYDLIYINDKKEKVPLTLGEATTRAQLEGAKIGESSFGVVEKEGETGYFIPGVSEVPAAGLPMSGVEKDQPIYGSYPTLRVGTQDAMATLQLTRAVSKLRFVLCQKKEKDNAKKKLVSIESIELDSEVIPTASYLMPVEKPSYSSGEYVPESPTVINFGGITKAQVENGVIPEVPNPMNYIYESQTAQAYEDLINGAVSENKLKELGPIYFRESDKKLTGTITYHVKERTDTGTSWESITSQEKTATFSMVDKGDFLRNHSWIVYVFYMDATIYVLTVTNIGMKVWASGNWEGHEVYNW